MINWLDALKRTAGSIGSSPMGLASRTAGNLFNVGKSLFNNASTTPASVLQTPVAPKTNNTPEIKGTTLSKPNFNPNANVLNQNLMTNYTQPQNTQTQQLPQQPVELPQLPQVSTPTPTLPTTPVESEADKFFKLYQQSFAMTPQEEALQTQLSNLTTGADLGVAGLEGQGRGIPLSLVRGQQEKLLKQAAIQAQPLQKQLELLQAQRQAQMQGAKAGMDYFKQESQAFSPMKVGAGETLIDPRTGQTIYQGPAKAEKQDFSNLKEVQGGLYNMATGQWEIQPKTSTGTPASNIKTVQGGLFDINTNRWIVPPKGAQTTGGSEYSQRITQVAKDTIKEIEPQVNKYTTGWGGLQLAKIAGTPAYNFASALDTLKSNIAFGALVQMREASKTGGALGQVSDREGQLLQSSLGALNQGQSPEAFKTQLKKIMESLDRWNSAVEKYGGGATGESLAQQVDALGYDYNQMIADGYDEDDIRNAVGL